jgi:sugar phosphate isomerase/epimerase
MHVSIRDDTLLAIGFDTIEEGLRHYGLTAVELVVNREFRVHSLSAESAPSFLYIDNDTEVEVLRRQANESGFRIAAFLLANNFNAPDIERELAWIVRVVEVAARLNVPAVRIDAIMHGERELPAEEREAIFSRGVRHVLDNTAALPVDLGIENHGFQGNDPAFLDGLLASINSPRLGLTMDTGNFYWAGHPLDEVYRILEHFAPVAKHTHIKNIRYPEELRNVRRELGYEYGQYVCPIPEGDIDHDRVIQSLKSAGYDRDLCIEDESLSKFDIPTRRANIQSAVNHLTQLL